MMLNVAHAQWSAINSGYAVTTDYHGVDVPPGTLVTATAGTTDATVDSVTFLWKSPDGNTAYTDPDVPVSPNGTEYDGKPVYYATSSHTLDVPGDWGVQALFIGEGGTKKQGIEDVIGIRATSFFIIPELPTIFLMAASLTALGIFAYKRKKY